MSTLPSGTSREAKRATTWGLLSTANINSRILAAARQSATVEVLAVASRDLSRAREYAHKHNLDRAYGAYEDLLADPDLDAIYISLPNHLHVEWSVRALQAGKHVLCEKPLGRDARAVETAFDVAARCRRLLSEGFMWRHHPQTLQLEHLLAQRVIGRVVEVTCSLAFDLAGERQARLVARANDGRSSWLNDVRMSAEYHGGALMDVGAYCVNAIRLIAGGPIRVAAQQTLAETGVDLRTFGVLEYANGSIGRFECSFVEPRREELSIIGEDGTLVVRTPFLCGHPGIELHHAGKRRAITPPTANSYQLQLENMSAAITTGWLPRLGAQDGIAQAALLEALQTSALHNTALDLRHPTASSRPKATT